MTMRKKLLIATVTLAVLAVGVGVFAQAEALRYLRAVEVHRGYLLLGKSVSLILEGSTNDANETTITVADPTADRTWTIPDSASDTFAGLAATQTFTNKTLTSPVVNNAMIAGGSTLTLTAAAHDGKTIALDTAAGTTITLPAATGSGAVFTFVVTVAATSNQHRIVVVGNDAFYGGIFQGNDTDNTTVMWPTAADADQINMSGTATGGVKGARYIIIDGVADGWSVIGWSDASGTEATPFATGQVS
jgi:hypothetical protein